MQIATSAGSNRHGSRVNHFEDFEAGRVFRHHWGRTVTLTEAISFATEHMLHEPSLFNQPYSQHLGYRDIVVSPLLVFNIVLGMSVEDLSESGGPFLGAEDISFLSPVYPDDCLFASSRVLSTRLSASRPEYGIVEWQTVGKNQDGARVIEFRRTNLVRLARHAEACS